MADFVERGGEFLMTGGYLSFAGFNGIAHYHDTVWEGYSTFWTQMLRWLAGNNG